MNWISVGEALPDTKFQRQMVIVATDKGIGTACYNDISKFHNAVLSGNTLYSTLVITHWMYLPAAPWS
ncbi:DUF551 domain-containing protein [Pantoea coffeiphila]|uniref:DUF551 domain-containing protein n=1 Tax=Pantoea coffeiphila TaxID=1465635 RepID=UPI0019601C3C